MHERLFWKETHYLAKQTQNSVFEKKNYYDKIFVENRPLRFGIKPVTVPRNVPDKFFYLEKILQNSFMQVISTIVQANSLTFVRFAQTSILVEHSARKIFKTPKR